MGNFYNLTNREEKRNIANWFFFSAIFPYTGFLPEKTVFLENAFRGEKHSGRHSNSATSYKFVCFSLFSFIHKLISTLN